MEIKKQIAHITKALIDLYYELDLTALHIILDDYNVDNNSIDFCQDLCKKENNFIGFKICLYLRRFSEEDRLAIINNCYFETL